MAAGERVLDQRTTALVNRLLVEADGRGFPLALLEMLRARDLRERYAACGIERAHQLSIERSVDQYERYLESISHSPFPAGARAWR